jgi:hypothetical protein
MSTCSQSARGNKPADNRGDAFLIGMPDFFIFLALFAKDFHK